MSFKLLVGDVLTVPVKCNINGANGPQSFSFSLVLRRPSRPEITDVFGEDGQNRVVLREFLNDYVIGWRGQRLVLDENDQPAEFSAEALACMLDVVGMEGLCFSACADAILATHSAVAKRGN